MSKLDYANFKHHPMAEQIVQVMKDRSQSDQSLFFRLMVANYFAMAAASMRTMITMPEGNKVPVNMYSLNLAPSNFGKTRAARIMTKEVLDQFETVFTEQTFPLLAERSIPAMALKRARRRASDPDTELQNVQREFERTGELLFCFDSGTAPGAKQLRHKLLMANAGAMNLVVDEVGLHMGKNNELLETFMELYDGEVGNTLNKNTQDNPRNQNIKGTTPSNMLLFGTSNKLLDGGKMEEDLMSLLASGYARRCFFAFVNVMNKANSITPEEALEMARRSNQSTLLSDLSDRMLNLADQINNGRTLMIPDDTALLMYAYKLDCEERANELKTAEDIRRTEMQSRFFKTIKLAGVYAFVDEATEITEDHLKAAIKVAEESGEAFRGLLKRDKPHVKLAKHIADLGEDVTHADLTEELTFYPKAANTRTDMLNLAISWGYKNNIIIKRAFSDGIEFLRGESLKETDLENMPVSVSDQLAHGYENHNAPWDKMHKMTQADGLHWINHHLTNGHRQEDNVIPGFNMIVLDVENSVPMPVAQKLLQDYQALFYTTKRHTASEHRYRILLPINYELKLDKDDYKEFMRNLFEWLPFEVDEQTNQRAKKWLSHEAHYEYQDGDLLDILPFIPKTKKNEQRREAAKSQQSLDNLERWFVNNTGDGNRNNQIMRYAMILVDAGKSYDEVRLKVMELNDKLPDNLDENEIMGTIMVTVGREMSKRQAA
jgi:hypothetical protein